MKNIITIPILSIVIIVVFTIMKIDAHLPEFISLTNGSVADTVLHSGGNSPIITSANGTGSLIADIAIFINGVQAGTGRRVPAINNGSCSYSTNAYSLSTQATLSAGTYTIDVRAKKFSTIFSDCYISSAASGSTLVGHPPLQGILNVMQFQ